MLDFRMRIGQFFSLQWGRVGQYLSPRVLVVRAPFQRISLSGEPNEVCYFGFDQLSKVQKFTQYLSSLGYRFELRQGQMLRQYPYEVKLLGHAELARLLAYWDRVDREQLEVPRSKAPIVVRPLPVSPAIAA